jgi:hypothetical protein
MAIIKSASITAMDASPLVEVTSGEGISGNLKSVNDALNATLGGAPGDIYRLIRFPTTAKVKAVFLMTAAGVGGAGAGDIDVAFSDSTVDGTPQSLAQLANPVCQVTGPVDNKLFGAAASLIGTATPVRQDKTYQGTSPNQLTLLTSNLPMWQVLVNLGATQFTADPGGYFDLIIKTTTAITVAQGLVALQMDYVQGP